MTAKSLLRACAVALAASSLSCQGAYLTAPPDSEIVLSANPTFVAAHGGVSEITALVIEPAGTYAADGTVVYLPRSREFLESRLSGWQQITLRNLIKGDWRRSTRRR